MLNLKGRKEIYISDREINNSCKINGSNLCLREYHLLSIQNTETHSTALNMNKKLQSHKRIY